MRSLQGVNKILAAVEFAAVASLYAARFSAKAIGAAVTSRRLLWLRQWQADARNKWRFTSAPSSDDKLFGASLEPLLIETKVHRKVLHPCQDDPFFASKASFVPLPCALTTHPSNPDLNVPLNPGVGSSRISRLGKVPDSLLAGHSEEAGVAPSVDPASSFSPLPDTIIGGRLAAFSDQWDSSVPDPWIRRTIRFGFNP